MRLDVGHAEGLAMTNGKDEPIEATTGKVEPDPFKETAEAAAATERRVLPPKAAPREAPNRKREAERRMIMVVACKTLPHY
jgi:hypothetical protein